MKVLVTVKLPNNPKHDPYNKKSGECPVTGRRCTDITGAHHTFMADVFAAEDIKKRFHVTRIEEIWVAD